MSHLKKPMSDTKMIKKKQLDSLHFQKVGGALIWDYTVSTLSTFSNVKLDRPNNFHEENCLFLASEKQAYQWSIQLTDRRTNR